MEDFVTFEIAKKLKEKKFPQHWSNDDYIVENDYEDEFEVGYHYDRWFIPEHLPTIAAPTISQVLKWLREEKEIMVFPVYSKNTSKWSCSIINADSLETYNVPVGDSYELAALVGIEYVLDNLI